MQPGAIPFDSTPKSFAVLATILISVFYPIRFILRHVQLYWPLLQASIALWLKRKKVDTDEFSGSGFGDTFAPRPGIDLARIIDEERNDPRANGIRPVRGPPITRPQSNPVHNQIQFEVEKY
jgi:hypothetical protein